MTKYLALGVVLLASVVTVSAQMADTTKSFIFGNSTIDHRPPLIDTPSDETTMPFWFYFLAQEIDSNYTATGEYNFPANAANTLPPSSSWGYDSIPPAWNSEIEPFSDADFDNVLLTTENFVQYLKAHDNYEGPDSMTSPLQATLDIFDWVKDQEEDARLYVYENWPEMSPYLSNGFPPSATEYENYNDYALGDFHDWWVEFQDSTQVLRPQDSIKFIPVGKVIIELLTGPLLDQIPVTELYEDDAPHGRASFYFLSGLVCYSAIMERMAPLDYDVPDIVHIDIRDNYKEIVNQIWMYLLDFDYPDGESRVFFKQDIETITDIRLETDTISAFTNPLENYFQIKGEVSQYDIDILEEDETVYESLNGEMDILIDLNELPNQDLYVRITHATLPDVSYQVKIKESQ